MAKESAKAKHFKGIYLPYWTFDAQTDSTYKGEYGIDETKTGSDGKSETVTKWHPVRGSYQESFDDELVCGSTNHNQSMLQGLEPYQTAENKTYKPEYVAGFGAERYSIGIKEAWEMAKENIKYKIKGNIENKIRKEKDADHVRNLKVDSRFSKLTYKYLLLPVWLSSYKYKEKIYQFMVNGQTGKVSGKTPLSIPKIIITALAAIAVIALICWLSSY